MNKTLLKTIYTRPRKGKPDSLTLVIKDNDTGEKDVQHIVEPEIDWYITKEKYRDGSQPLSIPEFKVDKMTSKYSQLERDMCYALGEKGIRFFQDCIQSRDFRSLRDIHLNPIFHQTDVNIEDHYIDKFIRENGNSRPNLSKSYFDIEVDGMMLEDGYEGFPDPNDAPAPVNAFTFFYADTKEVMTYLLDNPDNEQIEEFRNNIDSFLDRLDNYFFDTFETPRGTFNYNIQLFDNEVDLIVECLKDHHNRKPDFSLAWNMEFDIVTLINRLKKAGVDPESVFCHPDFPEPYLYYRQDTGADKFQDKKDYFQVSSYTNWNDMLLNYAQLRQGQTEKSYRLNDIAEKVIGEGKYEMDPGVTIVNFPYKDYEGFVFYNIVDVMLLYYMEEKLGEVEQLLNVSTLTRTRLNKAMTKTICLRNFTSVNYRDQDNLVMSNNRNKGLAKVRFKAAHVADPILNTGGILLNGIRSKFIFKDVQTLDFARLYPTMIVIGNMGPETQIGKIEFHESEDFGLNLDGDPVNGADLAKNMIARDVTGIAIKYMKLPTSMDISEKIRSGKYDSLIAG